jgi:hypothetical protein
MLTAVEELWELIPVQSMQWLYNKKSVRVLLLRDGWRVSQELLWLRHRDSLETEEKERLTLEVITKGGLVKTHQTEKP